jgi:Cold shock proteins
MKARVVVEVLHARAAASLPRRLHGRIDGGAPGADAAAAYPRDGDGDQRARAGAGEMVQSAARIRLSHAGRGTPDIFVHMETLRRFGLTELRPGQYVLVRFGPGPKGLMAAEVRPEGARTVPPRTDTPQPACRRTRSRSP